MALIETSSCSPLETESVSMTRLLHDQQEQKVEDWLSISNIQYQTMFGGMMNIFLI